MLNNVMKRRAELWSGNEPVRLTSTESALTLIFAAQPGQALSRLELVEELGRVDGETNERAIDVQIIRQRRKIEAYSKQPRYLQTVRGAGYMLVPDEAFIKMHGLSGVHFAPAT